MSQLLNIDGTDLEVSGYLWKLADQDLDSGRNLAGYMERNLLDHRINTLTITIPSQIASERQATINLLDKYSMQITFLSPKTNTMETHTMMHGDIESEIYWNVEDDLGSEIRYNSFQVQLVEY